MNILLVLLLLILPNLYIFFYQAGSQYPRQLLYFATFLGLLIFICLRLVMGKQKAIIISKNKFTFTLLAFLLLFSISSIFSISYYATLLGTWVHSQGGLIFTFSIILLFFIFYNSSSTKALRNFSIIFILGVLISIFWGNINHFGNKTEVNFLGHYINLIIRPSFTEYNPIYYASYIQLGIPLSLGLLFYSSKIYLKIFAAIAFLIIWLEVILSLTRGVWISSLLAVTFFILFYLYAKKINLKQLIFKPYFLFIFLIIVIATYLILPNFSQRLSTLNNLSSDNSVTQRMSEYKSSINIIKDHPYLGTGPDTIYYIFPYYRDPSLNNDPKEWLWIATSIRNYYLQLAATIGIPGLILFLTFNFFIFKHLFIFLREKKNEASLPLVLSFYACLGAILIEYFSYFTTITVQIIYWSAAGLLLGLINSDSNYFKLSIPSYISKALLFILLISTFFLGKFSILDYQAWVAYNDSNKPKNFYKNLELTEKAISLNPYETEFKKQFSYLVSARVIRTLSSNELSWEDDQNLTKAQKYLDFVYQVDPLDPYLSIDQATLSFVNYRVAKLKGIKDRSKEYEKALADAKAAFLKNPTRADVSDLITQVYLEADGTKTKEAEQQARETLILRSSFLHGWHHLGEALKQQGKFDEAVSAYEGALKIDPTDTVSKEQIAEIEKLKEKEK